MTNDQGGVRLSARAATDIGRRSSNEDAWLINEELGLFLVADGIGGHERGEVASRFASEQLERVVATIRSGGRDETLDDAPMELAACTSDELMAYAILVANRSLFAENEKETAKLPPPLPGDEATAALLAKTHRMGTTLVSLLVRGRRAWLTHVGDSRAYRIAGDAFLLLTRDHSWVDEQVRAGALTPDEARFHKRRNVITRSVGFKKDVEADIDILTLYPPERFLLCSDGLSNVVDEKTLLALARIEDLQEACDEMVAAAKTGGGKDNITAVLVEVTAPGAGDDAQPFDPKIREETDV